MLRHPSILAACVLLAATAALAESPEDAFRRAGTAYEQGRYDEAAEAYRSLVQQGLLDVRVEYNLGNAEFRLGHLGPAILHFERARRLDPVDPDIASNLALARSMCADRVNAPESSALGGWLLSLQERLGPDRQAWLVLAVLWALGALVAWCSARPRGWRARYGWILTGLVGLLLICAASWRVTLNRLEGQTAAVVLAEVADVLAGPGGNNPALFTVHEGLVLEVRAERDEWLQVSLPNGLNGWIARQAVEPV